MHCTSCMAQHTSGSHFRELCGECKRRHAEWVADEEKQKRGADEAGINMFSDALSFDSKDSYGSVWPVRGGNQPMNAIVLAGSPMALPLILL
jgi:hypothetical protein